MWDLDALHAINNPAVRASVDRIRERYRAVADLLLERLLVDGLEHRIQIEDIEALCGLEKTLRGRSPMLMRKVIIELMLSLRNG